MTWIPSAAPASATRIRCPASDSERRSDRVAPEIDVISALAAAATGGRMDAIAAARIRRAARPDHDRHADEDGIPSRHPDGRRDQPLHDHAHARGDEPDGSADPEPGRQRSAGGGDLARRRGAHTERGRQALSGEAERGRQPPGGEAERRPEDRGDRAGHGDRGPPRGDDHRPERDPGDMEGQADGKHADQEHDEDARAETAGGATRSERHRAECDEQAHHAPPGQAEGFGDDMAHGARGAGPWRGRRRAGPQQVFAPPRRGCDHQRGSAWAKCWATALSTTTRRRPSSAMTWPTARSTSAMA